MGRQISQNSLTKMFRFSPLNSFKITDGIAQGLFYFALWYWRTRISLSLRYSWLFSFLQEHVYNVIYISLRFYICVIMSYISSLRYHSSWICSIVVRTVFSRLLKCNGDSSDLILSLSIIFQNFVFFIQVYQTALGGIFINVTIFTFFIIYQQPALTSHGQQSSYAYFFFCGSINLLRGASGLD